MGLIPGSIRSLGGGSGNPLQYSCLDIQWTGEPDGLQSMGSQRVGHDSETEHACMQFIYNAALVSAAW